MPLPRARQGDAVFIRTVLHAPAKSCIVHALSREATEMIAKSKLLRTRDVRNLYRLLNECCELGADPLAWRQHLIEQVRALFGGLVAMYGEFTVCAKPFHEPFWLLPQVVMDFGWPTENDRAPFEEHIQSGRPEDGPHITPDLLQRQLKTVRWSQCPGRSTWLQTRFFNEYVKKCHLDDGLFAHHLMESRRVRWFFVNRALGERAFDEREQRLMKLLNLELARLLGRKLARLGGRTVTDLPPRQRDVLLCLMEGDNEKQAAVRLGLSAHTVHDYVKMLHRRFAAQSRGELLSRCRPFWPVLQQQIAQAVWPPRATVATNGHRNNNKPVKDP